MMETSKEHNMYHGEYGEHYNLLTWRPAIMLPLNQEKNSCLSTLMILILQQYKSVSWPTLVSIDLLLVSFKTLTCWCNVMFLQIVSRYIVYPRLPISAVKEFMAIFKWDKLIMVVEYLVFPLRKEKNLIECNSFIFFFFVLFSNFWMSNLWVNFSNATCIPYLL